MKTWSRVSSLICGRNECRLKRVTGGGPAAPARGVLIAPLGFPSITRNGNARANFF
jgi:hypothetical protein